MGRKSESDLIYGVERVWIATVTVIRSIENVCEVLYGHFHNSVRYCTIFTYVFMSLKLFLYTLPIDSTST